MFFNNLRWQEMHLTPSYPVLTFLLNPAEKSLSNIDATKPVVLALDLHQALLSLEDNDYLLV